MEIIFLGTSSGTPTKSRNLSGVALKLQNNKQWYLFDCGEATQHQLLRTPLSLLKLKAIFISHIHGDHCYGILGLLASASMDGRKEPLTIVAPKGIKQFIDTASQFTELNLSFDINFIPVEQVNDIIKLDGFDFKITKLSHRVPSYAFTATENSIEAKLNQEKLLAHGINPSSIWNQIQKKQDVQLDHGQVLKATDFLITKRTARVVTICGDNDSPELLNSIIPTPDIIIHESTYTNDALNKVGPEVQHSSAKKVAEFAESIKLSNLILTHFSARYTKNNKSISIHDIETEAKQFYSGKLFLADDFDCYHLNKQKMLNKV